MTSGKANRPINKGIKERQPIKLEFRKPMRCEPHTASSPTREGKIPISAAKRPLAIDPLASEIMMVSEKQISQKNSGAPKLNASLARYAAKKINAILEIKSAITDE